MTATGSFSIFIGPNGVRAGWRLLIFFDITAVLVGPFVLFLQPRLQRMFGRDFTAVHLILSDAVGLTFLLIAALIIALMALTHAWSPGGPEASVFDVIVTAAGILLLTKLYPAAKYPAL